MCDGCKRATDENQKLAEEVSGLLYTTRRQARSIAGLEAELRKQRRDDPEARQVTLILSEWKSLTGHLRAKIDETGDRWTLVVRRVKNRGMEDCLLAVRGMAVAPWMHYGKYRMTPCQKEGCCTRRDDIKDVFANDARFEELLEIGRRMEIAESEKLMEALARLAVQDKLLTRCLLDALAREAAQRLIDYSLTPAEYEARQAKVVQLDAKRRSA